MEDNNLKIIIGRPINSISINGLEYLHDNEDNILEFSSFEEANKHLLNLGFSQKEIDNSNIVFIKVDVISKQ